MGGFMSLLHCGFIWLLQIKDYTIKINECFGQEKLVVNMMNNGLGVQRNVKWKWNVPVNNKEWENLIFITIKK